MGKGFWVFFSYRKENFWPQKPEPCAENYMLGKKYVFLVAPVYSSDDVHLCYHTICTKDINATILLKCKPNIIGLNTGFLQSFLEFFLQQWHHHEYLHFNVSNRSPAFTSRHPATSGIPVPWHEPPTPSWDRAESVDCHLPPTVSTNVTIHTQLSDRQMWESELNYYSILELWSATTHSWKLPFVA